MTISEALRQYLAESGESMRGLSLRAGLGEKAVADILRLRGLKPRHATVQALSTATGLDLASCLGERPITYQELIAQLEQGGEARKARRVRWLMRKTGWIAQTRIVCRREVIEFFEAHNASTFNLSKGSYATYKSEVIAAVTKGATRQRPRTITDIGGIHGDFHRALKDSDLPGWQVGLVGSFLVFLHDRDIAPPDVDRDTLGEYFAHRLTASTKSEEKCRQHVKEIASFLGKISRDPEFCRFGFRPIPHPFEKSTGKYGIDNDVIAPLMNEFDTQVAPWALGQRSREGMSRKEFLEALDNAAPAPSDREALLLARRKALAARPGQGPTTDTRSSDELLEASGFLTQKKRWSAKTLEKRRGMIVALAKAIAASVDMVPQSMDELLSPVFLETGVDAIKSANRGDFPSGYLSSVLKCVMKIARHHQRRPEEDLRRIKNLRARHACKHKGIAPRNRAKLNQFDETRIQGTIDLGDTIIAHVNAEIDRRRKAHRRKHGVLPKPVDVIDMESARDIMAALAHEVLLRRAPRSDNVINARLDWIAWQGDFAILTIPACEVKMRTADDEPLRIPFDAHLSKLLRNFVDAVRAKALLPGDERNPFLFPRQSGQSHLGQPYGNLLGRVTTLLHRHVGVRIHPHLYRHLIGWIWLKESLDNLPKVQRLLGHKSLQTTIDYYAELDAGLVFDEWQDFINGKRSTPSRDAA